MVRYLTGYVRYVGSWVATRAQIKSERGATAVEYGVMVALIAAVIITAVLALGQQASDTFQCTADSIAARSDTCVGE